MISARSLRATAAIILIAFLVGAASLSSRRPPDVTDTPAVSQAQDLSADLRRCAALGLQQANDPAENSHCRAVWEENRRHFFGRATRFGADPNEPMLPTEVEARP